MKQFYEEELDNLILKLPDITNLGKEPELYIADMKLLLLLLLGCAVQCPNKEKFITNIKELHVDTQLAIVECIRQVCIYVYTYARTYIIRNKIINKILIEIYMYVNRVPMLLGHRSPRYSHYAGCHGKCKHGLSLCPNKKMDARVGSISRGINYCIHFVIVSNR